MRFFDLSNKYTPESLDTTDAADEQMSDSQEVSVSEEEQGEVSQQIQKDTESVASAEVEFMTAEETSTKVMALAQALDQLESSAQQVVDENEGTLPVSAATMTQASMESIMRCLGVAYTPAVTMESLRGTYSKKAATKVALESFTENIKKAFDAVISAIKNTVTAIFSFVASIFNSRSAVLNMLKSNLNRLKSLDKDKAVVKTPQLYGGFINALTIGGDFNPDAVISNTSVLTKLYLAISDQIKNLRDRGIRDENKTGLEEPLRKLYGFSQRVIKSQDGENIRVFGRFVNDSGIVIKDKNSLQIFHGTRGPIQMNPIQTLGLTEMITLTENAISMVNKMQDMENQLDTIRGMIIGMLRSLENEYNRLRAAMGSEDHQKKKEAFAKAKELQKVLNESIARIPLLTVKAGKAIVDLGSAVYLAYK